MTHTNSTPANPAQGVSGRPDFAELPEFWQGYIEELRASQEELSAALTAAIGASGQAVDQGLRDAAKAMGAEVARSVPVVGSQPHPADERAVEALVDKVLDAAGDYMGKQYGNTALHHPTDRARIKAALAQEGR